MKLNMRKNRIRLTESQLRRVIKESVMNILTEDDYDKLEQVNGMYQTIGNPSIYHTKQEPLRQCKTARNGKSGALAMAALTDTDPEDGYNGSYISGADDNEYVTTSGSYARDKSNFMGNKYQPDKIWVEPYDHEPRYDFQ